MLPTPSTPSLPASIYPPAEDTYLILDTLSSGPEISFLQAHFQPHTPSPLILDLGTGSGTILAFLLANAGVILGRTDVLGLGADVNGDACGYSGKVVEGACREAGEAAGRAEGGRGGGRRTGGIRTGTYLTTLNTSLLPCVRDGSVDLLVFNPPYVPSERVPGLPDVNYNTTDSPLQLNGKSKATDREREFERTNHLLSLSYDGGRDGMEVTNELLGDLPRVLSSMGVAYVLLCKANGVEEVLGRVRGWSVVSEEGRGVQEEENGSGVEAMVLRGDGRKKGKWRAEIVGRSGKVAGWEKLFVVRIWRGFDSEGGEEG
ncbi:S-adenosylmethionine-dependent methyltransferase [Thelotrema lepadinum]|nr:S-adenosylmethionine-dependent methyltransferase [Thelotrema lepadinum]